MINLHSTPSVKLGTILGYECHVPGSHLGPSAFLKRGCPVWIQTTESGDCETMVLGGGSAFVEIADFIRENLGRRAGYYYRKPADAHPLSCQILNEDDAVCAEILIDERFSVIGITLGTKEENDLLVDYFSMDFNIGGYESTIIRVPSSFDLEARQLFRVQTDEDGCYFYLC